MFLSSSMHVLNGCASEACPPFPFELPSLLISSYNAGCFLKKILQSMPEKDVCKDKAKIIDKSSRIFVILYFDKLEEVSCNLSLWILQKKKKPGIE